MNVFNYVLVDMLFKERMHFLRNKLYQLSDESTNMFGSQDWPRDGATVRVIFSIANPALKILGLILASSRTSQKALLPGR